MFISDIKIKNFRLFTPDTDFEINGLNIPDASVLGSGLNVIVGNNATGKTSILDAIALSLLDYKGDSFELSDMNDITKDTTIEVYSRDPFKYKSSIKGEYLGKGFYFKANQRKNNPSYLASPIVHDLLFIRADGETKPTDDSPDLRVNVNNPWSGKRFSENEVVYIEKNCTYSTKKGMFNNTKFDSLMSDFSRQFIKTDGNRQKLDNNLKAVIQDVSNPFLEKAINEFECLSEIAISLKLLDNLHPFKHAFFSSQNHNGANIPLNKLGSGYEVIFLILYLFYLSQQNKKQLIILIDEPELHLHPILQEQFIDIIFKLSKDAQVILTSHSPLLLKQIFYRPNINAKILKKVQDSIRDIDIANRVLNNISSNEINYLAYDLITEEFHNELYGFLQEEEEQFYQKKFDECLKSKYGIETSKEWIKKTKDGLQKSSCSLQTYIRNFIHHPENNENLAYTKDELKLSIEQMNGILQKIKKSKQDDD